MEQNKIKHKKVQLANKQADGYIIPLGPSLKGMGKAYPSGLGPSSKGAGKTPPLDPSLKGMGKVYPSGLKVSGGSIPMEKAYPSGLGPSPKGAGKAYPSGLECLNLVSVVTDKGMVACGAFNVAALDNFGYPACCVRSTKGGSIATIDDLLQGVVKEVNMAAEKLGIKVDMPAKQALAKM